jgi:hypothetical protein
MNVLELASQFLLRSLVSFSFFYLLTPISLFDRQYLYHPLYTSSLGPLFFSSSFSSRIHSPLSSLAQLTTVFSFLSRNNQKKIPEAMMLSDTTVFQSPIKHSLHSPRCSLLSRLFSSLFTVKEIYSEPFGGTDPRNPTRSRWNSFPTLFTFALFPFLSLSPICPFVSDARVRHSPGNLSL